MDEPPELTELGEKDALAPVGSPETLRATLSAEPAVTAVLTATVVLVPWLTEPEVGLAAIEKSLGTAVTMGSEISQDLLELDQVACMGSEPVAKATFCAPPVPPVPTQAQVSPFS